MSVPVPALKVAPPSGGERLRLHYLDGLRGLAAFYVVLHHAFLEIAGVPGWLPSGWSRWTVWAWNGRIAVQVFIALSGYCLMMPVARSGHLKGGCAGFIGRRARRILPPYYAALAFSLAVITFVPGMGTPQGLRWDEALPAWERGTLGSHLLLLQDLRFSWIYRINQAMWTISQEWQLYFVFAFVLLPLWRRAGIVTTLVFALLASVVLRKLPWYDFSYAATDFLFLFAVGMGAATLNFADLSRGLAWVRDRLPWGWLTFLSWAVYVGLALVQKNPSRPNSLDFALLMGGVMLSTLVYCTSAARRGGERSWLLRLCEAQPVVILGTFSYSLYLVHLPILSTVTLWQHRGEHRGLSALAIEMLLAVPLATALAYGFHLLFERPFMLGHPATLPRAEKAAILDAAP